MFEYLKTKNLKHLATNLGWLETKNKTTKLWVVMEKKQEKILFKNQPNENGHWVFKNLATEKSGTAVDLLLAAGQSMNALASQEKNILPPSPCIKVKEVVFNCQAAEGKAKNRLRRFRQNLQKSYLTTKKFISQEILKYYGILSNDTSAVFPLAKNKIIVSSILYNSDGGKFFQKIPGARTFGAMSFLYSRAAKNTVIFESPVDALSFAQLLKNEGKPLPHLISTCGSLTKNMLSYLKKVSNLTRLFCSFDNDLAGKKMTEKLKGIAIACKKTPKGKDWSEELQSSKM